MTSTSGSAGLFKNPIPILKVADLESERDFYLNLGFELS